MEVLGDAAAVGDGTEDGDPSVGEEEALPPAAAPLSLLPAPPAELTDVDVNSPPLSFEFKLLVLDICFFFTA
jgi:hypothetical protein